MPAFPAGPSYVCSPAVAIANALKEQPGVRRATDLRLFDIPAHSPITQSPSAEFGTRRPILGQPGSVAGASMSLDGDSIYGGHIVSQMPSMALDSDYTGLAEDSIASIPFSDYPGSSSSVAGGPAQYHQQQHQHQYHSHARSHASSVAQMAPNAASQQPGAMSGAGWIKSVRDRLNMQDRQQGAAASPLSPLAAAAQEVQQNQRRRGAVSLRRGSPSLNSSASPSTLPPTLSPFPRKPMLHPLHSPLRRPAGVTASSLLPSFSPQGIAAAGASPQSSLAASGSSFGAAGDASGWQQASSSSSAAPSIALKNPALSSPPLIHDGVVVRRGNSSSAILEHHASSSSLSSSVSAQHLGPASSDGDGDGKVAVPKRRNILNLSLASLGHSESSTILSKKGMPGPFSSVKFAPGTTGGGGAAAASSSSLAQQQSALGGSYNSISGFTSRSSFGPNSGSTLSARSNGSAASLTSALSTLKLASMLKGKADSASASLSARNAPPPLQFNTTPSAQVFYGSTVAFESLDGWYLTIHPKTGVVSVREPEPNWYERGLMPFQRTYAGAGHYKEAPHYLFRLVNLQQPMANGPIRGGDPVWLQVAEGRGDEGWTSGSILAPYLQRAIELDRSAVDIDGRPVKRAPQATDQLPSDAAAAELKDKSSSLQSPTPVAAASGRRTSLESTSARQQRRASLAAGTPSSSSSSSAAKPQRGADDILFGLPVSPRNKYGGGSAGGHGHGHSASERRLSTVAHRGDADAAGAGISASPHHMLHSIAPGTDTQRHGPTDSDVLHQDLSSAISTVKSSVIAGVHLTPLGRRDVKFVKHQDGMHDPHAWSATAGADGGGDGTAGGQKSPRGSGSDDRLAPQSGIDSSNGNGGNDAGSGRGGAGPKKNQMSLEQFLEALRKESLERARFNPLDRVGLRIGVAKPMCCHVPTFGSREDYLYGPATAMNRSGMYYRRDPGYDVLYDMSNSRAMVSGKWKLQAAQKELTEDGMLIGGLGVEPNPGRILNSIGTGPGSGLKMRKSKNKLLGGGGGHGGNSSLATRKAQRNLASASSDPAALFDSQPQFTDADEDEATRAARMAGLRPSDLLEPRDVLLNQSLVFIEQDWFYLMFAPGQLPAGGAGAAAAAADAMDKQNSKRKGRSGSGGSDDGGASEDGDESDDGDDEDENDDSGSGSQQPSPRASPRAKGGKTGGVAAVPPDSSQFGRQPDDGACGGNRRETFLQPHANGVSGAYKVERRGVFRLRVLQASDKSGSGPSSSTLSLANNDKVALKARAQLRKTEKMRLGKVAGKGASMDEDGNEIPLRPDRNDHSALENLTRVIRTHRKEAQQRADAAYLSHEASKFSAPDSYYKARVQTAVAELAVEADQIRAYANARLRAEGIAPGGHSATLGLQQSVAGSASDALGNVNGNDGDELLQHHPHSVGDAGHLRIRSPDPSSVENHDGRTHHPHRRHHKHHGHAGRDICELCAGGDSNRGVYGVDLCHANRIVAAQVQYESREDAFLTTARRQSLNNLMAGMHVGPIDSIGGFGLDSAGGVSNRGGAGRRNSGFAGVGNDASPAGGSAGSKSVGNRRPSLIALGAMAICLAGVREAVAGKFMTANGDVTPAGAEHVESPGGTELSSSGRTGRRGDGDATARVVPSSSSASAIAVPQRPLSRVSGAVPLTTIFNHRSADEFNRSMSTQDDYLDVGLLLSESKQALQSSNSIAEGIMAEVAGSDIHKWTAANQDSAFKPSSIGYGPSTGRFALPESADAVAGIVAREASRTMSTWGKAAIGGKAPPPAAPPASSSA